MSFTNLESFRDLVIDDTISNSGNNQVYLAHEKMKSEKIILKMSSNPNLLNEYKNMKKISHSNVIKPIEAYSDINQNIYLYSMPFALGGDLFSYYENKFRSYSWLSEEEVRNIMRPLFSAVNCIHQNELVHCDLKPENIYFEDDQENSNILIGDFGSACKISDINNNLIHMTSPYAAPEILQENMKITEKIDCWALGIIMYLLLYLCYPFYQKSSIDNIWWDEERILKGDFFFPTDDRSYEAKDLINHLICVNADERFSAKDALNHKWFQ